MQSQYPEVIYPTVSAADTLVMQETEHWRQRLLELEAASGLSLHKDMAARLQVEPSYYSRLRYPPGKPGRKNLGLDTMRAAIKAFGLSADWFDLPLGTALPNRPDQPFPPAPAPVQYIAQDGNRAPANPVRWPFHKVSYLRLKTLLDRLEAKDRAEAVRDLESLLDVAVERWERRADQRSKRTG